MGSATGHICRGCGTRFRVRHGGGFFFDLLHCDRCGAARLVSHQALGEIHLRYVKGLPGPYAVARSAMDARIKATYPGEPLDRRRYEQAAEASIEPCGCGGRFRYGAVPRCPGCGSTAGSWDRDPKAGHVFYD